MQLSIILQLLAVGVMIVLGLLVFYYHIDLNVLKTILTFGAIFTAIGVVIGFFVYYQKMEKMQ